LILAAFRLKIIQIFQEVRVLDTIFECLRIGTLDAQPTMSRSHPIKAQAHKNQQQTCVTG
jgi:hypothetical protein